MSFPTVSTARLCNMEVGESVVFSGNHSRVAGTVAPIKRTHKFESTVVYVTLTTRMEVKKGIMLTRVK